MYHDQNVTSQSIVHLIQSYDKIRKFLFHPVYQCEENLIKAWVTFFRVGRVPTKNPDLSLTYIKRLSATPKVWLILTLLKRLNRPAWILRSAL